MDWTLILIVLLGFFLYLLWSRVKILEEKTGENSITRLRLSTKNEIYDLPFIKELAHLETNELKVPYSKLPPKSREKFGAMVRKLGNKLNPSFLFFNDKNLVFSQSSYGSGFGELYSNYFDFYSETLGETKDGKTVEFIIKSRVDKKTIPNSTIPVLTGYLKKSKQFSFDEKDKEIVILFDIPRFLILPLPPFNKIFGKSGHEILSAREQLLPKFGLEKKVMEEPSPNFEGGIKNDFGELEYINIQLTSYENKYYEVRI